MSKYDEDRAEAYEMILEAGAMGTATMPGNDTYDPGTSKTVPGSPSVVNVPMTRASIDDRVRLDPNSLVSATDVRLLVAAQDDKGVLFNLKTSHVLSFAGVAYSVKASQPLAPDGGPVMYDVMVSGQ